MKEYQKPSVTSNQEVVGFFPAIAFVAGLSMAESAAVGAAAGVSAAFAKKVTLEREQYPYLEAVLCA